MANVTGGQITWNLDVDNAKFKRGMAEARREAGQTADHIDKSGGSFTKLGGIAATAAKTAVVALGAATAAATVFGVKSAASFEQTRIGLENMLGSADAARATLAKVSKFAAETPFEFPELAQATRQLVAFGFSAEEAFNTMTQLGDVSAAVGAPINDLAYLMGTLRAQGRAFTIDIRQFAMRGIPIYEYLAKVLGKNTQQITEMIEAGKIGFPEVQKAFQAMTAEGGKFHGTMAKQSKSLSGLFSTLKDTIGQAGREIVGITAEGDVKAGSLFDRLRQGTERLIEVLPIAIDRLKELVNDILPTLKQWATNIKEVAIQIAEYLGPKLEALWNTLNERLIPALTKFWKEIIEPLIPVLGTTLVVAIGAVIDIANGLLTALSGVINFLADHEYVFWLIVSVLGAIRTALFLNGALAAFQGVIAGATSSYAGLQALVATPMVMPAIVVAAALVSLNEVRRAVDAIKGAIEAMNDAANAQASMESSNAQAEARLRQLIKTGTPEQKARALKALSATGAAGARAAGGPVSAGKSYIVGEEGMELFTPRSSGVITPNDQLSGGAGTFEYNIGTINISSEVDGERWLKKLTRNQEVIDNGLTPSKAVM